MKAKPMKEMKANLKKAMKMKAMKVKTLKVKPMKANPKKKANPKVAIKALKVKPMKAKPMKEMKANPKKAMKSNPKKKANTMKIMSQASGVVSLVPANEKWVFVDTRNVKSVCVVGWSGKRGDTTPPPRILVYREM